MKRDEDGSDACDVVTGDAATLVTNKCDARAVWGPSGVGIAGGADRRSIKPLRSLARGEHGLLPKRANVEDTEEHDSYRQQSRYRAATAPEPLTPREPAAEV